MYSWSNILIGLSEWSTSRQSVCEKISQTAKVAWWRLCSAVGRPLAAHFSPSPQIATREMETRERVWIMQTKSRETSARPRPGDEFYETCRAHTKLESEGGDNFLQTWHKSDELENWLQMGVPRVSIIMKESLHSNTDLRIKADLYKLALKVCKELFPLFLLWKIQLQYGATLIYLKLCENAILLVQ